MNESNYSLRNFHRNEKTKTIFSITHENEQTKITTNLPGPILG